MNSLQEQMQDLMHRVPVLLTEQLEFYFYRTKGIHSSKMRDAIASAGKAGRLLVSRNGYVTTKEYLSMVQDWDSEPELNEYSYCRLQELHPKRQFLDQIDCFWVVTDMWEESGGFCVTADPFQFQFVKESGDRFVQILRMPADSELSLPLLLRSLPWPDQTWMERLQRIAVVASPEAVRLVPRVGFTHICMIDPKSAGHVRLLQKREGSAAWNQSDRLI